MTTLDEELILVTPSDRAIGTCEKLHAHRHGLLHRAFSVVIQKVVQGETLILLQRRHPTKYHSGNLWTNACCSHPRPYETTEEAAKRRLFEEMGIKTELEYKGFFIYHHEFSNGLTEHELDHVFIGTYTGAVIHDPVEVSEYRWVTMDIIRLELKEHANQFTPWFYSVLKTGYDMNSV